MRRFQQMVLVFKLVQANKVCFMDRCLVFSGLLGDDCVPCCACACDCVHALEPGLCSSADWHSCCCCWWWWRCCCCCMCCRGSQASCSQRAGTAPSCSPRY